MEGYSGRERDNYNFADVAMKPKSRPKVVGINLEPNNGIGCRTASLVHAGGVPCIGKGSLGVANLCSRLRWEADTECFSGCLRIRVNSGCTDRVLLHACQVLNVDISTPSQSVTHVSGEHS
ncbi:hypothetical protein TNCT_93631, partial [Trichonephila clavata]